MKDHLVHFHYEAESDLALHSGPMISGFQPLEESIVEGNPLGRTISPSEPPSSPSTVSSLTTTSADPSILPNIDLLLTNKYKSNNSKRVAADSVLGQQRSNVSGRLDHEEKEFLVRKRQFTEKVFQMWSAEVKGRILFSSHQK
jgi:hypothetical protein